MKNNITTKEAAARWGLSERRVNELCKTGRIVGAYKNGRCWAIPADAQKPIDSRYKDIEKLQFKVSEKLPMPIGISEYKIASTEYYYVDKTMLIKDFIDERPKVSLFTRPRRFGKTLNMDMLRVFFEKTDEDTSIYFRDKKIWQCGEEYRKYQGKYPVIFVTFKDIKFNTWEETFSEITDVLRKEYDRHKELLDSDKCSDNEKEYFQKILNKTASQAELTGAFRELSQMLHEHYGTAPIIIIDEYDIPIQQGHMKGFYDEIILFMRNLFSGGLKDNQHLSYGFLTGILRVAKESIFSGLNNLAINSILDSKYSEYFGFTVDEVKDIAEYYGAGDKLEELSTWYDGYRYGNSEIFNPWSIINYFRNSGRVGTYWQSTGSNDIIGEILEDADEDIYDNLQALIEGKAFSTYIDTGVIYPQIKNNPSSIYSFLLVAGYLNAVKSDVSFGGDYMCEVAIPNKEITFIYQKEILNKLTNIIPQASSVAIQEAIYVGDTEKLKKHLHKFLMQTVSNFDTSGENFYHGLILGICAMVDNKYIVSSNRESGYGRFDIQLMPKSNLKLPGILIELKAEKFVSGDELKRLAKVAINQINEKQYETEMRTKGIDNIIKYGIAFSGKSVEIAVE